MPIEKRTDKTALKINILMILKAEKTMMTLHHLTKEIERKVGSTQKDTRIKEIVEELRKMKLVDIKRSERYQYEITITQEGLDIFSKRFGDSILKILEGK